MYDSFVQETQGERKGLSRCFDFRKSLEKSERKEWGNRAWRGRKVEGIIAGELKEKEKNREKREKKMNEPFVQRAQFHPRAVLVTV